MTARRISFVRSAAQAPGAPCAQSATETATHPVTANSDILDLLMWQSGSAPVGVLGHVNYHISVLLIRLTLITFVKELRVTFVPSYEDILSFPPSEGPQWEEKGRDQTHERRYRQRLWLIR